MALRRGARSTSIALLDFPPLEELPEPLRGKYVVMLRFSHNGPGAEGAELLAPMLEAGDVLLSGVSALPYSQADAIHQDPTDPLPAWEPNAVAGREGAYSLLALGVLKPGHERLVTELGESVLETVAPWTTGTSLLNWLGATATSAEVARAWKPNVHRRLMTVKRAIDPDNVFRFGHALAV